MERLTTLKDLQLMANQLRQDVIAMLYHAGSGHAAGSLGMAEIFAALYFNVLKHNPAKPFGKERDRLVLSNGHICPIRYAALARSDYFPLTKLSTLRKLHSSLQGHPSRLELPALETSSGSLGHGLGIAAGMALAAKLNHQHHRIFCITSDGEHDEGSTWEAVNAAHKYKLNNLVNIIDYNNIQISGYVKDVWPLASLKEKYHTFHWPVLEIDGHDFKQILPALQKAGTSLHPLCIIAHTVPGKGVSFMENKFEWHGKAPNKEEALGALLELQRERKKLLKNNEKIS